MRHIAFAERQPLDFQTLTADGSVYIGWKYAREVSPSRTVREGLDRAYSLTRYLRRNPTRLRDGHLDAVWSAPGFYCPSQRAAADGFLAGLTRVLTHGFSPPPSITNAPRCRSSRGAAASSGRCSPCVAPATSSSKSDGASDSRGSSCITCEPIRDRLSKAHGAGSWTPTPSAIRTGAEYVGGSALECRRRSWTDRPGTRAAQFDIRSRWRSRPLGTTCSGLNRRPRGTTCSGPNRRPPVIQRASRCVTSSIATAARWGTDA